MNTSDCCYVLPLINLWSPIFSLSRGFYPLSMFFSLFSIISTAPLTWCPLFASDLGGLSWPEGCWRSVWRSAVESGVGDGSREPYCVKGAAGPFRQHPDALLRWGSLRHEWLCTAWRQDRHLESWVENTDRESTSEVREKRRKKAKCYSDQMWRQPINWHFETVMERNLKPNIYCLDKVSYAGPGLWKAALLAVGNNFCMWKTWFNKNVN